MTNFTRIEKVLLDLPAHEREKLAVKAWESLVEGGESASDSNIDPEGVKLAGYRDGEMDQRSVIGISHEEFRRRTELRD